MSRDEMTNKGSALLAELRKKEGLTYRALGKKAGCSPGYLHMIESGNFSSPRADFLVSLASALNYDPDSLCVLFGRFPPDVEDYVGAHLGEVVRYLRRKIQREKKEGETDGKLSEG